MKGERKRKVKVKVHGLLQGAAARALLESMIAAVIDLWQTTALLHYRIWKDGRGYRDVCGYLEGWARIP